MLLLLGAMSLGLVETTVDNTSGDTHQRLRDVAVLLTSTGSNGAAASGAADPASSFGGLNDSASESENPFRSIAPGTWTIDTGDCGTSVGGGGVWRRPNQHLYFQLGNACFFVAFLATHGAVGQLWLRSMLCVGCVLLALWGWMVECSSDAVLWSGVFLAVNAVHVVVLLVRLRPVRFEPELEAVYAKLFRPLRVSRLQFRKVLGCMRAVRVLKCQEVYAQEKVTKVDSLTLVLGGKLVVSQNQRALHIVFPHQFLDSPEWFGVMTDEWFQVSIMAMEDSRVLIWHRDKLKLSIMSDPFLETVFDHVLGRDVVRKLMQVTAVNETMAAGYNFLPTSNGCIGGSYDENGMSGGMGGVGCLNGNSITIGNGADDKEPMLVVRAKNGTHSLDLNGLAAGGGGGGAGANNGHGITALINRQLQDEQAPLLNRPLLQRTASVENLSTCEADVEAEDSDFYQSDADRRRHIGRITMLGAGNRRQHGAFDPMKTSMC